MTADPHTETLRRSVRRAKWSAFAEDNMDEFRAANAAIDALAARLEAAERIATEYREACRSQGLPDDCPVDRFVHHHQTQIRLAAEFDSFAVEAAIARMEAAERDLADARKAMEFLANEALFGSIVAEYAQKKLAAAQQPPSSAVPDLSKAIAVAMIYHDMPGAREFMASLKDAAQQPPAEGSDG